MTLETRPTRWTVAPPGEPVFSERATVVEITDEAGGEYVTVQQQTNQPADQRIAIEPEEWPALRLAIDAAVKACREYE